MIETSAKDLKMLTERDLSDLDNVILLIDGMRRAEEVTNVSEGIDAA